ncbi:thiamine phosphate synthase [Ahrensia sp. R2A130]|uniref:thiamine phosphate synthase n=1 Tax=Ahrensia sp. R2A130 TaxID=744979 RepID=UPI0001E0F0D3|nr:thiamine phosphate synthase [Ahrensia sp. R2A130]EFL88989.1 thiamine-phosphate pyrophosphorylase [Ahrensia sp. R2A130]
MTALDISLYGILDPARSNGRPLPELAAAAARGGATLLQYRDKTSDTRTMVETAHDILEALEDFDIPLLINDRVDVALAVGAHGVHLGQTDMETQDARDLLGDDAIIGLTIKNRSHATNAPVDLLDYVCIGGVFQTLSKDNPVAIGLDGWSSVAGHFRQIDHRLPVGAIAGIDETNCADVMSNGADGVAIISAMFMADDVEAVTKNLVKIIKESRR